MTAEATRPLAGAGLLDPMLAGAGVAFSSVFVEPDSPRLRQSHVKLGADESTRRFAAPALTGPRLGATVAR